MNLTKTDLKEIIYEFNSRSNRLLQSDWQDYSDELAKYLNYLKSTPLIYDFISDCGECDLNVDEEISNVISRYGRCIFNPGETDTEEIRNIFSILVRLIEQEKDIPRFIATGYSSSKHYQDKVKGFNNRFVKILIGHIENFLTKVGIKMGLDEKQVFNVSVQNGQAIFARDNATVTATNTVGVDTAKLEELLAAVRNNSGNLSNEEKDTVEESIEVIDIEMKSAKPRKSFLKTAVTTLKTIAGTAEFAAAVAALIQFVQTFIP